MCLPPSPALSACNSLDGIDLDAHLESQGTLSHFPTPPLKKTPVIEARELEVDEIDIDIKDDDERLDYTRIAPILAENAGIDTQATPQHVCIISDILFRTSLPVQVIAIAHNIIARLHIRERPLGSFIDTPPDLVVVGALSLAAIYIHDHPPRYSWWSRHVCHNAWTAIRIEKTVFRLFATLDFRLYGCTTEDSIKQAKATLLSLGETTDIHAQSVADIEIVDLPEKQPLKLLIDGVSACWQYGQMTPESTPPCSGFEECRLPLMRFLPLL